MYDQCGEPLGLCVMRAAFIDKPEPFAREGNHSRGDVYVGPSRVANDGETPGTTPTAAPLVRNSVGPPTLKTPLLCVSPRTGKWRTQSLATQPGPECLLGRALIAWAIVKQILTFHHLNRHK